MKHATTDFSCSTLFKLKCARTNRGRVRSESTTIYAPPRRAALSEFRFRERPLEIYARIYVTRLTKKRQRESTSQDRLMITSTWPQKRTFESERNVNSRVLKIPPSGRYSRSSSSSETPADQLRKLRVGIRSNQTLISSRQSHIEIRLRLGIRRDQKPVSSRQNRFGTPIQIEN